MRVAVTGASGFIGTHVVAALTARGDTAIPIKRPFEPATLASTLQAHRVDVVVHLAGLVSTVRREDFFAANVGATRIVARATRDAGARLVHISSLAAAGPSPPSAPRSEDDAPSPITPYGQSKLEGERAVRELHDLRWTILRPGVVYGPGDRAMLPLFRYAGRGVLPLVGDRSAAYTFIYVHDAVRAILAAADREPAHRLASNVIFIGHERPVTSRRLLETVRAAVLGPEGGAFVRIPRGLTRAAAAIGDLAGALTGRPATINRFRYAELYAPGFVCRVDRLHEQLGVVAGVDLTEGVRRTADWYRDRAWLYARRGLTLGTKPGAEP